jgi:putative membrane protein
MRRMGFLALAVATAVTVGCNRDARRDARADAPAVGTAGTANISNADRDLVKDIAIANMAEVELGRLAAERGAHAEIKKYGQMMVDDHTNSIGKLKALAAQHNLQLPTELDDDHRDLLEKLAKKQGGEFDRDYIEAMIEGHEDVLDKLASRIDKENLAEWRTRMSNRVTGEKAEERVQAAAIMPEASDDKVTMSINQWAADTYPVVYAHLEAAKALDETIKRRTTN